MRQGLFAVFLIFILSSPTFSQEVDPQDNYKIQVFLTEEEALRQVFPQADEILTDSLLLSPEDRNTLEERLKRRLFEEGFLVYVGKKGGEILGYAVITQEIGKFHPFDFIVAVRPDGKIRDLAVLVYRESRGGEVAKRRFLHQFIGKSSKNPLRINKDIINITGATMSVVCLCEGVKKVLALVDAFYISGRRNPSLATPYVRPASYGEGPKDLYKEARLIMGTYAEVSLYAPNKEVATEALKAAFEEMERLDRLMSNYKPDSELSRINQEAVKAPVTCDRELLEIIEKSLHYSHLTEGSFDITVGPLVNLWGFYDGKVRIPSREEVRSLLPAISYKNITTQGESISFANPSTRLDLGAIGKGYAVDRAVEVLKTRDITSACVNLGGNIYALGTPPGRDSWKIGVQHPREKERLLGHLELRDCAVATSGDYERFFVMEGKRYSHLLDPRTGWPVEGMVSVTVIAPNATEADALSTSAFVLGEAKGKELLEGLKGTYGLIAWETGEEINFRITRGMEQFFKESASGGKRGGSTAMRKDAKTPILSLVE
jgi:thiamine biosynthesis lipoprotein ApbE